MKVRRTQYVTVIWTQATVASPGSNLMPSDYGWHLKDNILQPTWFQGPATPSSLFRTTSEDMEIDSDSDDTIITAGDDIDFEPESLGELTDYEDEPWSEDSDSDHEDEME